MTPRDAASILPRKTFDCEFKAIGDAGSFEMYALVFGNVDRQGDLIEPGAVSNLDELVKDGWIALNHDQTALPIAMIDTAAQDGHGLKLTGTFHSTPTAQECRTIILERMASGKAVKTSIGYLVPADGERYEKQDGRMVRHISKLSVYEASYVNLPANPEAEIVSAKSFSPDYTLDGFEDEETSMAVEKGMVEALRKALGLATKGGRKMSGATLEKMKTYAKSMDDHGDKCMATAKAMNDQCKMLKSAGEAHKAMADEFTKCLKDFEGGKIAEDDEGDEEEGDEQDDKSADPEDTADGDPPKKKRGKVIDESDEGEDEKPKRGKAKDEAGDDEEKALNEAYRNSLRRRALIGKFSSLNQGGTNGN